MNASVSVIIPTFNGAAYIADALSSVFAQTIPPREIIVVDDCSKDDTPSIVEKIACRAPIPIQLVRLSRNSGGPARPINVGVETAGSELIAVLDQDDLFVRDKLQHDVLALTTNPQASVAAGLLAFYNDPHRILPEQLHICNELGVKADSNGEVVPGFTMLRHLIVHGQFLGGFPSFTFRKAHWKIKRGLDESLPVASDYDVLCWLCRLGDFILRPAIHYLRRQHENNVCNNRQKMYLDIARVRGRYLKTNCYLLREEVDSQQLSDFFTGLGYWLREAGNYRSALECYRLTGRVWGWNRSLLAATAKVPLHWLSCRFFGRQKIITPYTIKI